MQQTQQDAGCVSYREPRSCTRAPPSDAWKERVARPSEHVHDPLIVRGRVVIPLIEMYSSSASALTVNCMRRFERGQASGDHLHARHRPATDEEERGGGSKSVVERFPATPIEIQPAGYLAAADEHVAGEPRHVVEFEVEHGRTEGVSDKLRFRAGRYEALRLLLERAHQRIL